MNQRPHTIPPALQQQVLIRIALAALCLLIAVSLLFLESGVMATPFLLAAAVLTASAVYIHWAAASGGFLELTGVVLKVEGTLFRSLPKALLMEVEGKALRVVLHNRHRRLKAGDRVTIFISGDTRLYPWRGLHQLSGYLALTIDRPATESWRSSIRSKT